MKKNIRFIKKEQNGGNIKKLIRIQIKNKSNLSEITHLSDITHLFYNNNINNNLTGGNINITESSLKKLSDSVDNNEKLTGGSDSESSLKKLSDSVDNNEKLTGGSDSESSLKKLSDSVDNNEKLSDSIKSEDLYVTESELSVSSINENLNIKNINKLKKSLINYKSESENLTDSDLSSINSDS